MALCNRHLFVCNSWGLHNTSFASCWGPSSYLTESHVHTSSLNRRLRKEREEEAQRGTEGVGRILSSTLWSHLNTITCQWPIAKYHHCGGYSSSKWTWLLWEHPATQTAVSVAFLAWFQDVIKYNSPECGSSGEQTLESKFEWKKKPCKTFYYHVWKLAQWGKK